MTEDEAIAKYKKYKSRDPFPKVPCALLNSADIADYVEATGMIEPFYKGKLKSASYEAAIAGTCKYWDESGKPVVKQLDAEHKDFELPPNSIAFVEIEPAFRLPDYIAVRFNLKITHVYRGLLLGTGPLIDPGFEGKIFIPLHNLTANPYTFSYREDLIWMEFTKVSLHSSWDGKEGRLPRVGEYVPFPENKKNKPLDYYLHKATKGKKVVSSIPAGIKEAWNAAKKNFYINIGVAIAAVGLLATIVGILLTSWSSHRAYVEKSEQLIARMESELNRLIGTQGGGDASPPQNQTDRDSEVDSSSQ